MGNLQTYNGAVAWRGPEVAASSDWSPRFTASEVAALAAAADKVTGREIVSLRAADFDLCALDPVLAKIRADLTDGRGFALLRGLPVDDWPIARTARAYWAICSHVGQPIAQNQVGNLLGQPTGTSVQRWPGFPLGHRRGVCRPTLPAHGAVRRQVVSSERGGAVERTGRDTTRSGGNVNRTVSSRPTRGDG